MSGADVLRQVRDALGRTDAVRTVTGYRSTLSDEAEQALAALDGCVVLTREEANLIYRQACAMASALLLAEIDGDLHAEVASALTLLTPEETP